MVTKPTVNKIMYPLKGNNFETLRQRAGYCGATELGHSNVKNKKY